MPDLADATPDQLAAAAANLDAIHTVEACIRAHHVVEIGYVNEKGVSETFEVRPAFIKTSRRGHVVVWATEDKPDGHWLELRVDGIRSAHDTGREFTPSW